MAQQVTQYRSDNGKSFDNEHDAWREDVMSWFQTVGMNEGVARQLLDSLDNDTGSEAFGTMLAGLHRTRDPLPEPPMRDHALFSVEGNPNGVINVFERSQRMGRQLRPVMSPNSTQVTYVDDCAGEPPKHVDCPRVSDVK